MHSRLALRVLSALGTLADADRVATSALDLLTTSPPASGHARWSRNGAVFEWADRPQWAADKAVIEQLLEASEDMARDLLELEPVPPTPVETAQLAPA
jgi:hypothetical protein